MLCEEVNVLETEVVVRYRGLIISDSRRFGTIDYAELSLPVTVRQLSLDCTEVARQPTMH
jgi:hypothetical protein